jgi:CubicO group peptidase (beta-lactamase class C family)
MVGARRAPLLFAPGSRWSYSVATDVCGHLIERLSGQRFDVLSERILGPLEMVDTGFPRSRPTRPTARPCYACTAADPLVGWTHRPRAPT